MEATNQEEEVIEYDSSVLGTKHYWDEAYKKEIDNFTDHGDEGEVWFGEEAMDRIFRWMDKQEWIDKGCSRVLDLGCGNGVACVEMACEGFSDVTGVDYSHDAVKLAQQIAKARDVNNVKFKHCDILADISSVREAVDCGNNSGFDLVLDKGTFDAISLCPEDAMSKRAKYIENVAQLIKQPAGRLVITSCNFTQNELNKHFQDKFELVEFIPTPTFSFGGATGNMVTSGVFKKR